ncbi:MAG: DNA mismatch repair endonuclease MutL [Candidatus Sumerlaeia bacterium]
MKKEIQVLPQTLINQIAAGEVIVRPASVVKELVENSFDAESTRIRVEMSQDGRNITVRDDGTGMDEANARRAVLRHSTSKIRTFDDLENLATRGFRGEALASIIAVSRFELLTRQAEELSGIRLMAAGGKIEKFEAVGAAPGATIHVRDLFYNTPARLKFLKSPAAEFNAAVEILTQQALSHPEVGLSCIREGKVRFDLPPGQDFKSRIEELLGSTVKGKLIEVKFQRGNFGVRGYIAHPEASRKDRRWQYLMVNGRPISAKQLSFPIQEAYKGLLMKQRFPVIVLDLRIDPTEVDVNVHPTKEEVRFEEERKIGGLLYRAITETLDRAKLIPTLEMDAEEEPDRHNDWEAAREMARQGGKVSDHSAPPSSRGPSRPAQSPQPPRHASRAVDPSLPFVFSPQGVQAYRPGLERRIMPRTSGDTPDMFPPSKMPRPPQTTPAPEAQGPPTQRSLREGPPPEPLGQVGQAYIIAEWGEDLLLIDQHAAHERLNYTRLKNAPREKAGAQALLIPIDFDVPPADADSMELILPLLREMGIEVEDSDKGHYSVTALPSDFHDVDVAGLVQEVLEDVRTDKQGESGIDELRDKITISMACHASIKAGQKLSQAEMVKLINEMVRADLPFTCPHGRPTMILMEKDRLDRQFKRK